MQLSHLVLTGAWIVLPREAVAPIRALPSGTQAMRQFGPDYRFAVEESRGSGDQVFVCRSSPRAWTGQRPVAGRSAYVYTVRDGEITRVEMWFDREAALTDFRD
jgi:ketosteroid isomerase-like protein